GIHKFMGWNGSLLSDSGGFQVFSLVHRNPEMGMIHNDGVKFRSPIDGAWHDITPEKSIQIQFDLGTDMMVCFDDCPPNDYSKEKIKEAVMRTISWAKRCKAEYEKQIKKRKIKESERPLLFGVIQGGAEFDLRELCTKELVKIGFDGYGFGAMPVDEKGNFLGEILKFTADLIPEDSLRFALGIGSPDDIDKCARYGWDMFDCVIPTREGRHGRLFLWKRNSKSQSASWRTNSKEFYETINIGNSKFTNDFKPINQDSRIPELRGYSRAYLHHLFKSKEPLGSRLASMNNLEFYMDLMERLRKSE
ncbi:MAG: tRNA guanosine(34) transglycosylase Tgt, partial [Patescibacteria group bacterium]